MIALSSIINEFRSTPINFDLPWGKMEGILVNSSKHYLLATNSNSLPSLTPLRSGTKSPSMAMATSISALTSSLSSLSFSSQISHKPVQSLSLSSPKPLSLRTSSSRFPALVVVAASSAVADPSIETADLKKLVKSRLPGGFAAQTIIGTGRRKCAIARVVLQEGSGKIIINYRDATVLHFTSLVVIDCFLACY